jgi:hypothetical protein
MDSTSGQLPVKLNELYEGLLSRDKHRADLFRSIKTGFDSWKSENYTQAIIDFKKVQEYEYNPLIGFYICFSYLKLNDLGNTESEINTFYNNIALEKFETSIALPGFYHAQAILYEKKGLNDSALHIYSNLNKLWNLSDDNMYFKTQILNKLR